MRALRTIALAILIFLGLFTATAVAAEAMTPQGGTLLDNAQPVLDAIMHGQWWLAASLMVIIACALVKKYMPAAWMEGVKGDMIGTAMVFMVAAAGAVSTALVAPGATISTELLLAAGKVGLGAIGGYTLLHKVLGWLAGWAAMPVWLRTTLQLLGSLVGSDAIATAKAAGDAAVAAAPASTGLAGDVTVREVK
jgi:hypothetical protein